VKHYYDAKNYIYGLKTEVAVTAAKPHLWVASSPHYPGSTHDYTIHKQNFERYKDYLVKTPLERMELPHDAEAQDWAVLGDKAYLGPVHDTPTERRITPFRPAVSTEERQWNTQVSADRIHIEHFFGRIIQTFTMFHNRYRLDHANFDIDFQNACLLTNEAIIISVLSDADGIFYKQQLSLRCEIREKAEHKRKQTYEKYKLKKKDRLATVQPVPEVPHP
jgi:hypothetical protein